MKDNAFSHTFGPFGRSLYPGAYTVIASFKLSRQKSKLRSQWRKTASDDDKKNYKRIIRTDFFNIGTVADTKIETAKLRRIYTKHLEKMHKVFEKLQTSYAAASKCLFYKGGKAHEDIWKEYCLKQKLCQTDEQFEEIKKNSKSYVGRGGKYLKEPTWRRLLKAEFAKVISEYKSVKLLSKRFVTPRFPKTDAALVEMSSLLVDMFLNRTVEMQKRTKLKLSDNLRQLYEVTLLPTSERPNSGRYMQLRNKSLRELNPTKIIGEADPEKKGKK